MEARAACNAEIAKNVAHANTPGYTATKVDFKNLVSKHHSVHLAKTNSAHISGSKANSKFAIVLDNAPRKPNGNNVSLPAQMAQAAQNQDKYNEALRSYTAANHLVSLAIGNNNSSGG